jgi:hypothetical protein
LAGPMTSRCLGMRRVVIEQTMANLPRRGHRRFVAVRNQATHGERTTSRPPIRARNKVGICRTARAVVIVRMTPGHLVLRHGVIVMTLVNHPRPRCRRFVRVRNPASREAGTIGLSRIRARSMVRICLRLWGVLTLRVMSPPTVQCVEAVTVPMNLPTARCLVIVRARRSHLTVGRVVGV